MSMIYVCAISGIDAGGYVFENVFHMQSADVEAPVPGILDDLCSAIIDEIIPPYKAAICDDATLLNVSAKIIAPGPTFTYNRPIVEVGSRTGVQTPGAVAAVIKWFPTGGAITGRQFIPGSLIGDWVNDKIQATLGALLTTLRDAFLSFDGGEATYHWQFGIWNKATPAFLPVTVGSILGEPTTLNKRMRA